MLCPDKYYYCCWSVQNTQGVPHWCINGGTQSPKRQFIDFFQLAAVVNHPSHPQHVSNPTPPTIFLMVCTAFSSWILPLLKHEIILFFTGLCTGAANIAAFTAPVALFVQPSGASTWSLCYFPVTIYRFPTGDQVSAYFPEVCGMADRLHQEVW